MLYTYDCSVSVPEMTNNGVKLRKEMVLQIIMHAVGLHDVQ